MSRFLALPESIIISVVHDWLALKECVALDTSISQKGNRSKFLDCLLALPIKHTAQSCCLKEDGFLTAGLRLVGSAAREFDIIAMLSWLELRRVSIESPLKVEVIYNQVDALLDLYRGSSSRRVVFAQVKELRFERRKFSASDEDPSIFRYDGVETLDSYTNSDSAPEDLFACLFSFFPHLEDLTLPAHLNEKMTLALIAALPMVPQLQRIRTAFNLPTPIYTQTLHAIGDKIAFLYEFLLAHLDEYTSLCQHMERYVITPHQIPLLSSALLHVKEVELVIPLDQADSVSDDTIALLEAKLLEFSQLKVFRCANWPLASFGRIMSLHPSIASVSDDQSFQCIREPENHENSYTLKISGVSTHDNYQGVTSLIEGASAIGRLVLEDNAAITSFVYKLPDILKKHYHFLRQLSMTYYLVHNVRDCLEVMLEALPALETLAVYSFAPLCIDWRRQRWEPILRNLLQHGKKLHGLILHYLPVLSDDDVKAIVTELTNLEVLDLTNDYNLSEKTIHAVTIPGKVWRKLKCGATNILHEHIVDAVKAGLQVKKLECDKGNCYVAYGRGFVPLSVEHLLAEPLEILQEK
eukprot:gene31492-38061_t